MSGREATAEKMGLVCHPSEKANGGRGFAPSWREWVKYRERPMTPADKRSVRELLVREKGTGFAHPFRSLPVRFARRPPNPGSTAPRGEMPTKGVGTFSSAIKARRKSF